jgi:hypothetical protein
MQTESANTPEPAAEESVGALVVEPKVKKAAEDRDTQAMTALTYVKAFKINSPEQSVIAQTARGKLNTRIKELDEERLGITRKIDAAKEAVMSLFRGPRAKFVEALQLFDKKILAYDDDQKRIQREAQAKVENDARIERERLQAIADETQRKADEETDRLRKEAADKAAAGDEAGAAKLISKAERTEEKAAAKVETFTMRAASVVAPIIQSESAKASGSSFRDNWKWRLTDIAKVSASFKHEVPRDAAIDAIVKSMKGNAEAIAAVVGEGIEIYNDRGLASRRA